MIIEIFYDGEVDTETPALAEKLKTRYKEQVEIKLINLATETAPPEYGIINPPLAVLNKDTFIPFKGPAVADHIASKAIF